jgi:hypothetical protein
MFSVLLFSHIPSAGSSYMLDFENRILGIVCFRLMFSAFLKAFPFAYVFSALAICSFASRSRPV